MLSKILKKNKTILAIFVIFILFVLYVYTHKDIIEGVDNMINKKKCNDQKCRKLCPDLDIQCLKDHAEVCGDCTYNVSELSEKIENKSFHNNMAIEQPPQKPVNIYVMNQNDPHDHGHDERYMLGILPNQGPSSVNKYNESIIFSGPKKKNYVLVNPTTGENNFPLKKSVTGMFTETGYYPNNVGNEKGISENAAPNVDQFKQPEVDGNIKKNYTKVDQPNTIFKPDTDMKTASIAPAPN